MDRVANHTATDRRIIPRSLAITTDVFGISRLPRRGKPLGDETNTGRVYGLAPRSGHRDLPQPTVMETSSRAPTYQSPPFSCEPNRTGAVFEIAPVALVKLVLEPSTVSTIWLPLRLQVI